MVEVRTVDGLPALINLEEVDSFIMENPRVCRVNFKGYGDMIGDSLTVEATDKGIFKKP